MCFSILPKIFKYENHCFSSDEKNYFFYNDEDNTLIFKSWGKIFAVKNERSWNYDYIDLGLDLLHW